MKRKYKKVMIASLCTLITGGTITGVVVNSSINNHVVKVENKVNDSNFDDNLRSYFTKIQKQPLQVFDPTTNPEIGPYKAVPLEVNNPIYKPIFDKIDTKVITSDFFNFIYNLTQSYSNSSFKYKINDFKVNQTTSNGIPKYHLELDFDIFNPTTISNSFTLDQSNTINNVIFKVNEIKSAKITIDSSAHPYFAQQAKTNNIVDLYANYYFDNVNWTIGGQSYDFGRCELNYYSPALNTVVENVNIGKNYFEIKDEVEPKLKELTGNDFKEDVKNNFNNYWDKSIKAIGASQRIIKQIILQKPLLQTFQDIAVDANILTENTIAMLTPELKGFGSIIQCVLENKTIPQLLANNDVKSTIITLTKFYMPDAAEMVENALSGFNVDNESDFDFMFKTLLSQLEKLGNFNKDIINQIAQIKNQGLLDILFKNQLLFDEIFKLINPDNKYPLITNIQLLFDYISQCNPNKDSLLKLLLGLIQLKDSQNNSVILNILNTFLKNGTLTKVLNLFIFDNPSLTLESFSNLLSAIANPVDDANNIVNLEEYAKTINVVHSSNDFNFNQETLELIGNYQVKYLLTKKITFDLSNIYTALPSWLQVIISSAGLPNKLEIFPNDYFSVGYNFNGKVNYNPVISFNNQYKLSWTSLINETVDINLPQTAKSMYDNSSRLLRSVLIKMYNSLFFKIYTDKKMFSPINSPKLNETLIDNFSPIKKNGNAILEKELTQEQLKTLTDKIKASITEKEDRNIKFEYAKGWLGSSYYIYKLSTVFNYDEKLLFQELFNTSNCIADFSQYINCNLVVPPMSILGISTPQVPLFEARISLPFNVCTNNNKMKNSFVFKI